MYFLYTTHFGSIITNDPKSIPAKYQEVAEENWERKREIAKKTGDKTPMNFVPRQEFKTSQEAFDNAPKGLIEVNIRSNN